MNEACKIGDTCKLEICCFDLDSIRIAATNGVPSIEVCLDYSKGGLWPGIQFLDEARILFPGCLSVMIRPRPGNFDYEPDDLAIMQEQIRQAVACGVDGITLGFAGSDGLLPISAIRQVVGGVEDKMVLTFHRAFDLLNHQEKAIPVIMDLGFSRVLSSGGGTHAVHYVDRLAAWQKLAGPGLDIVAAGKVRPDDLPVFYNAGLRSVHSAASTQQDGKADLAIVEGMMRWCSIQKEML
jgi:copper homeostasis protein